MTAEAGFKNIKVLEATELKARVVKFEKDIEVEFGVMSEHTLLNYPFLRILEVDWLAANKRELSEKDYFSYFSSDFVKEKGESLYETYQLNMKKGDADTIKNTDYAKKVRLAYVKGAALLMKDEKTYCLVYFDYAPGYEGKFTKYGVLEEGTWKWIHHKKLPLFLNDDESKKGSEIALRFLDRLKGGSDSGYLYYSPGSNTLKPAKLELIKK